jgi:hypothetical protein
MHDARLVDGPEQSHATAHKRLRGVGASPETLEEKSMKRLISLATVGTLAMFTGLAPNDDGAEVEKPTGSS